MSESTHAPLERKGTDLLRELATARGLPIGAHLQIADRCNHACVHCYQVQGLKGELSTHELFAVIDGLADAGVLTLNVSGGEATLRPDLLDILRHARGRGFALRLYTNAFGMTASLAEELGRIGLHEVHVSVYSDREHEHDAVTRVPGSLARTLDGIHMMRARGVRVVMKTPSVAPATGAMRRVESLAASLGCGFQSSTSITPREDGSLETMAAGLTGEQLVAHGVVPPWLPGADLPAQRSRRLAGSPCGVCRSSITVLPNGDVQPCTDTTIPLGNLTEKSLTEIYHGSPDVPMLRSLHWRDIHGCRDCDLIDACSRCHATALSQAGDYLGPYEAACDLARARYAAGVGRPLEVLPIDDSWEPRRVGTLGPYRIESPGVLRPILDALSPEDESRRAAHPWVHRQTTTTMGAGIELGHELVSVSRLRSSTRRRVFDQTAPSTYDEKGTSR